MAQGFTEDTPRASDIVQGKSKLSVAPVNPYNPIAVGDNDPRLLLPFGSNPSFFTGQAFAVWTGVGLIFDVIWPIYYLNQVQYPAGTGQVTLGIADPVYARFDAIIVDANGANVIPGDPANDPLLPTANPLTQLVITYISVLANATTPSGITEELVFNENTEWTPSTNGTVNFAAVTNPFVGTVHVDVGAFNNTHYIKFTDSALNSIVSYGLIRFYIRLKSTFSSITYLKLRLYNGAIVASNQVNILDGLYGFNRALTGGYQIITIPISAFNPLSLSQFDTLQINFSGSNANGFDLDYISFQGGVTSPSSFPNFFSTFVDNNGDTVNPTTPSDTLVLKGVTKTGDKEFTVAASNFVGTYTSLTDLETAYPTATDGNYAYVDLGADYPIIEYAWDVNSSEWTNAHQTITTLCYNDNGSILTKGTPVYTSGSTGQKLKVKAASNDDEVTSSTIFGLVLFDIPIGQDGYIVEFGFLKGFDTSLFLEGAEAYLGVSGTITTTKPSAPNHLVYLGKIINSHAVSGSIFVKVQNGFEIDELHNVAISTPSNGDIIKYNSATSLWENQPETSGGGHTIQDEGTPLTQRTNLNFVGGQVAVTDDAGNDATIVTVDAPPETVNTIGALIDGATAATPNDTDLVATSDTSVLKKITWTNVKAFFKTYFDTLYVALTGTQTIAGDKTFSGATTLGQVKLDGTPDTDETANGPTTNTFNAGGSITKFQLCYIDGSATWQLADADAESTAQGFLAISLETQTIGNAMSVALPGSFVRDDSWSWTVGALLYVSTTAGSLTETQPTGSNDVIRIIGYAVASNIIYFNPSGSFVTHI